METNMYVAYVDEKPRTVVAIGESWSEVVGYVDRKYSGDISRIQIGRILPHVAEEIQNGKRIELKVIGRENGYFLFGTEKELLFKLHCWDYDRERFSYQWCIHMGRILKASGRTMRECFDDYLKHNTHVADYEELLIEILKGTVQIGLITPSLMEKMRDNKVIYGILGIYYGYALFGIYAWKED